jgi:hypothetical protein
MNVHNDNHCTLRARSMGLQLARARGLEDGLRARPGSRKGLFLVLSLRGTSAGGSAAGGGLAPRWWASGSE